MNTTKTPEGNHHYLARGRGKPVVLLHGMAASLHSWDRLLPPLTEAGHKVYALDLLGHGQSEQPEDPEHYHIDNYYQHLLDWLESTDLNGAPFSLVSHSMGAYLGLLLALRQPQRLERMVLLDPFYKPAQLSQGLRLSAKRPQLSARVMQWLPDWLAYPIVRFNPRLSEALPVEERQRIARDYIHASPNIVYTAPSTRDLSRRLAEIKTETLVIWGEEDPTLDPGSYPELVEAMPAAQGQAIPEAGHMPHLSRQAEVQAAILAFLNDG